MLYAADYGTAKVAVWDINLKPVVAGFVNSAIPTGFAPFNIQNLAGTMYVTYAAQPGSGGSPYATTGGGYVSTYDMNGVLLGNLSGAGVLNYPWGLAIAPATFGKYANMALVGNFGDGTIRAFDPKSGAFMGTSFGEEGQSTASPVAQPRG